MFDVLHRSHKRNVFKMILAALLGLGLVSAGAVAVADRRRRKQISRAFRRLQRRGGQTMTRAALRASRTVKTANRRK
jgi:hypothetical protein